MTSSRILTLLALSLASTCLAQTTQPTNSPLSPVSQVHALLASLNTDPRNLANWVLLGDAAERVALEQGGPNAASWLALSRQAFESALLLDPGNPHLQAAITRTMAEESVLQAPPSAPPAYFAAPVARRSGWRRLFEPDPSLLRRDANMPMYRPGVRGGLDQSPAQPEIP